MIKKLKGWKHNHLKWLNWGYRSYYWEYCDYWGYCGYHWKYCDNYMYWEYCGYYCEYCGNYWEYCGYYWEYCDHYWKYCGYYWECCGYKLHGIERNVTSPRGDFDAGLLDSDQIGRGWGGGRHCGYYWDFCGYYWEYCGYNSMVFRKEYHITCR